MCWSLRPEQPYDLEADPEELENLAGQQRRRSTHPGAEQVWNLLGSFYTKLID
jgi:hypothetical protein